MDFFRALFSLCDIYNLASLEIDTYKKVWNMSYQRSTHFWRIEDLSIDIRTPEDVMERRQEGSNPITLHPVADGVEAELVHFVGAAVVVQGHQSWIHPLKCQSFGLSWKITKLFNRTEGEAGKNNSNDNHVGDDDVGENNR